MGFSERDFLYMYYILFVICIIGLIYIFILTIFIAIIVLKYKVNNIEREVDVRLKYENHFRIYEKNEKVVINKANKRFQEIHHSFKAIDKTIPKQNNLLLETIVQINGKKQYSDKHKIENKDNDSNPQQYYVRQSYEKTTKKLLFDGNGNVMKRLKTSEKMVPIVLIDPGANQMIRTEIICAKIPIQIQRNRIIVKREEPIIQVTASNQNKIVLDVISYGESTVPSLLVTSQTDETSLFSSDSKPVVTSDTLISNIELNETKALENSIDIKEIPTVGSHLKIKEVPLVVNQIRIYEKRGLTETYNSVETEVIDAEVPVVVEKTTTERRVPNLIPISVYKTRILQKF